MKTNTIVFISMFLLVACQPNKDYTCTCKYGGSNGVYRTEVKGQYNDVKKSTAQKKCTEIEVAHEKEYPNPPLDSTITCELD